MADQDFIEDVEESEDLFGFADLYQAPESAPPNAPTRAYDQLSPAPAFDESDCLFNFDEVGVEADIEEVDAASILASVPDLPEDNASAPAPAPAAPQVQASSEPVMSGALAAALPATSAPNSSPSRFNLSPRSPLLWILLASIMLNIGVIGFTWRVSGKMSDEFGEATKNMIQATRELQTNSDSSAGAATSQSTESPIVIADPEHEFTFDRARDEIANGEPAKARKRLYALLAITDRLPIEVRERIESTAQFLLADITMQVALGDEGNSE